jgi:ABC-type multidrug transport system fused ATPase/permease subunit
MLQEPEENDVLGADGTLTPDVYGQVEFKNISMRYGPKSPWALRDVSFVVRPGMKVGLVGASGSGKSTTLNLLPRFYPFETGEILIDNVPIQNLRRDHLRSQLGFVGQDTVITAGTVRSNLLSGISQGIATSDDMLLAACGRTGLDLVLKDLPDGLDQNVVEGGDNLSMGQRQLIALTRMLLRNPRIMILDEATANIDERAEKLVQAAVVEVMEGRTTFVIAHRLSTIEHCDVILVFRDGRIVEHGTHESLRSLGAYYHQLPMGRGHQLDAI